MKIFSWNKHVRSPGTFSHFSQHIFDLLLSHYTPRKQFRSLFLNFLYVFLIEDYFLVICGGTYRRLFISVIPTLLHLLSQLLVFPFEYVEIHFVSIFEHNSQSSVLLNKIIFLLLQLLNFRITLSRAVF